MDEQSRFFHTVETLYSAALEDTQWDPALEQVAQFVGGHAAFYLASHPVRCQVLASRSVGVDPTASELLLGPLANKEVRMAPALRFGVGTVLVDRGLVDWRAFRRSEIYNEICAPYDVPNLMALWLKKQSRMFVSLSIESSARHGQFSNAEIQRFSRLAPYLVRAHRLRELMAEARQAKALSEKVLERMPFGVVSLDFAGQVIEMTSSARETLSKGALVCRSARLHAAHSVDDAPFQNLLQSALHWRGHAANSGFVALRRPAGRPLTVVAVPVARPLAVFSTTSVACMLLLIDPDRKVTATAQVLKQAFNFTTAESRLAARIFHGDSLAQAARELEVSYNTCKSQMKAIFDKTGCTSQVELAKKMMLVAALGSDVHPA